MRDGQTRQPKNGFQIDLVDLVPGLVARRLQSPIALHTGIVAEHVDTAEPADRPLDDLLENIRVAKIANNRLDLRARRPEPRCGLLERRRVTIDQRETCATLGKKLGDAGADPHGCAGDDRHPAFEVAHFRPTVARPRVIEPEVGRSGMRQACSA